MSGERFDDLARALATELPRRRVLLLALGAIVAAGSPHAARASRGRRPAGANCRAGELLCTVGTPAAPRPAFCCAASNPICCANDSSAICCEPDCVCGLDERGFVDCVCPRCRFETFECGDTCCRGDAEAPEDCIEGKFCARKCPPGSTRCGLSYECCPPGGICVDGETKPGERFPERVCRCKDGRDFCFDACCKKGETCVDGYCMKECETETDRRASRYYDPKTQCCTGFGIERKYPIRYFERCRKTRVAREGHTPSANGCGPAGGFKVPDTFGKASFLAACNAHDICYDTCRSDRAQCDRRFLAQLLKACADAYPRPRSSRRKACERRARDYHDAVAALGELAYDAAQSKACQCCP